MCARLRTPRPVRPPRTSSALRRLRWIRRPRRTVSRPAPGIAAHASPAMAPARMGERAAGPPALAEPAGRRPARGSAGRSAWAPRSTSAPAARSTSAPRSARAAAASSPQGGVVRGASADVQGAVPLRYHRADGQALPVALPSRHPRPRRARRCRGCRRRCRVRRQRRGVVLPEPADGQVGPQHLRREPLRQRGLRSLSLLRPVRAREELPYRD